MQPLIGYKELEQLDTLSHGLARHPVQHSSRSRAKVRGSWEATESFVWAALILAAGVLLVSSIFLEHPAFAASTTTDSLVDISCPNCEGFQDRRLQVTKDADGTMTSLQFRVISTGESTGEYSPDEIKGEVLPMYEQSGYTVVKLDARQVNPEVGGVAQLKWYSNVVLRSGAESLTFEVSQNETGDWGIEHRGQRVRRLIVQPSNLGVDDVKVQY